MNAHSIYKFWAEQHPKWEQREKQLTQHASLKNAYRLPWWKTFLQRKGTARSLSIELLMQLLMKDFSPDQHHAIGKYFFSRLKVGLSAEECFALEKKIVLFLSLKEKLNQHAKSYQNLLNFKAHTPSEPQEWILHNTINAWLAQEQTNQAYYKKVSLMTVGEFEDHLCEITQSVLHREELLKTTPEIKSTAPPPVVRRL